MGRPGEYGMPTAPCSTPTRLRTCAGPLRRTIRGSSRWISPRQASRASDNFRVLNLPGQVPHLYAVVEAGAVWSWRHAEVLLSVLEQRGSDLPGMGEALMCGSSSELPALRLFDHGEPQSGHFGRSGVGRGRNWRDLLSRVFPSGSFGYYYTCRGAFRKRFNFLIFADLWEHNAMVRRLYRRLPTTKRSAPRSPTRPRSSIIQAGPPPRKTSSSRNCASTSEVAACRASKPAAAEPTDQQGGTFSADFWDGHLSNMKSRVCSAIRGQPASRPARYHGPETTWA